MVQKRIGCASILLATLLTFAQPTLAQDEPVVHQTLFTNVNVFDGTSEKLLMAQEVLVEVNLTEDLQLLMKKDKFPMIMKDGKIYQNVV